MEAVKKQNEIPVIRHKKSAKKYKWIKKAKRKYKENVYYNKKNWFNIAGGIIKQKYSE